MFSATKKLLFECKKHGKDNENEWNDMVPPEGLRLEHRDYDDGEHS